MLSLLIMFKLKSMCWGLISIKQHTISCLLLVHCTAYFVAKPNNLVSHSLLHIIFWHKLCLFCKALIFIKTCSISCLLHIHWHIIKLVEKLISIDDVFPWSNVWLGAKVFLMFVACLQNMGKKCCKKKSKCGRPNKSIIFTLGQIMYSWACPLDHDFVLWVQLQIYIMATKYPNAFWFIEYLKDHWTHKATMWCVGNRNIPHVG
jgi:hypothetical protein